jgi:hypothetical protein
MTVGSRRFSVGHPRVALLAATTLLSLVIASGAQALGGVRVAGGSTLGPSWHAALEPHSVSASDQAPPPGLSVAMQLMPESLTSALGGGILVAVRANQSADGIATVSIPHTLARRAHIKSGSGRWVAIGRGTVWQVKDGTVLLHLRLARATAAKLKGFGYLAMRVRLSLYGLGGHVVLQSLGRY